MLRLLLDEHIPPAIAVQVRARNPAIAITSMREWEQGAYLHAADEVLLQAAYEQRLSLMAYDQRTIGPLLKVWGEQGTAHGGVIFVNRATFAQNDIGSVVRALLALWSARGQEDWVDRVVYLARRM